MNGNLLQTLANTAIYQIYAIMNCGWYVVDKKTKNVKHFDFNKHSYTDVMSYAESIS